MCETLSLTAFTYVTIYVQTNFSNSIAYRISYEYDTDVSLVRNPIFEVFE